ncbi:putative mitogen-activated protein kinase organizer [Coemansia mojavensis]|nr:putative mitogen-activated protein kinase organizer [Coemansia mojavensis]
MKADVVQRLTEHTGSVNTAIFDATGGYVISGGQDKRILLSNSRSGQLVQSYNGHGWAIQDIAITRDSSQLVSCGGDRMVFVWDVNIAQIKRKLTGHQQRVDCIATNKDGSIVASGSFDTNVCIWDLRAAPRTPLQMLKESKDGVSSLVLSDTQLIAGSIDGSVRTYDMRMAQCIVDSLGTSVVSVALAGKQAHFLAVGCMDSSVQLLDRNDQGKVVAAFTGHRCTEYRIHCDANDSLIASGSQDGCVYVWDIAFDKTPRGPSSCFSGHKGIVNSVNLHPQSDSTAKTFSMVSAGSDGNVVIWG